MVIVYRGYGNHSNQLIQSALVQAFCIENRLCFLSLPLAPSARLYGRKFSPAIGMVISKLSDLLVRFGLATILVLEESERKEDYETKLKRMGVWLVENWRFDQESLVARYRDSFVRNFTLRPKFFLKTAAYAWLEESRSLGCRVVGVHVRRGDYDKWKEGRYFFEDATYLRYVEHGISLLEEERSGSKVAVLVVSNETVSLDVRRRVFYSTESWYVDQFLLSQCELIVGPPSTFSLWAGFLGNVKKLDMLQTDGPSPELTAVYQGLHLNFDL